MAVIMVLAVKTTLIIEDKILKKAKEQAAIRDTTVSELVNRSLRAYLHAAPSSASPARVFAMPVFGRTAPRVLGVSPDQMAGLRDDGR